MRGGGFPAPPCPAGAGAAGRVPRVARGCRRGVRREAGERSPAGGRTVPAGRVAPGRRAPVCGHRAGCCCCAREGSSRRRPVAGAASVAARGAEAPAARAPIGVSCHRASPEPADGRTGWVGAGLCSPRAVDALRLPPPRRSGVAAVPVHVCGFPRGAAVGKGGTRCPGPPPTPPPFPRGAPRCGARLRFRAGVAGAAGPELARRAASPGRGGSVGAAAPGALPAAPCVCVGAGLFLTDSRTRSVKRVFRLFCSSWLRDLVISSSR